MKIRPYLACFLLLAFCGSNAAEEYNVEPDEEVKAAVDDVRNGSPQLERQMREYLDEYETLKAYDRKPTKKTDTIHVSRKTLELPFEFEVTEGFVSTLTFMDSTGQPYPARFSRVGDKSTFHVCTGHDGDCAISEGEEDVAHILTLQTDKPAGRSNMKVVFSGLSRAIVIPLVSRKKSYHDNVTVILPYANPNREVASSEEYNDQNSYKVVDDGFARALIDRVDVDSYKGVTQLDIKAEQLGGAEVPTEDMEAIFANGNTYIRTKLKRPTPSPTAVTPGYMGELVYRLSGKPRSMTGFDTHGNLVSVDFTHPDQSLGYREFGGDS